MRIRPAPVFVRTAVFHENPLACFPPSIFDMSAREMEVGLDEFRNLVLGLAQGGVALMSTGPGP